jgi:hypothetical protein
MAVRQCCYCHQPNGKGKHELRPYGPDGADICFGCMTSTPEREAAAGRRFGALLDEANATTGKALATEEGPIPFIGKLPGE